METLEALALLKVEGLAVREYSREVGRQIRARGDEGSKRARRRLSRVQRLRAAVQNQVDAFERCDTLGQSAYTTCYPS